MPRPLTLFTGQWADLPLETLCQKAKTFGYDGLELAAWGDHFDVQRALEEDDYVQKHWELLQSHGLECYAVSNHLVGQCVCDDPIDERHKGILPPRIWGDGDAEGVRQRSAQEMKDMAAAVAKFFDAAPDAVKGKMVRRVINGFTGSSIWTMFFPFPPMSPEQIQAGYTDFADRWTPILDVFDEHDVNFALEVHPTEIAFDSATTRRAIEAIGGHPRFGVNFDPSHFGYQGTDYLGFLREFHDRIFHVHVKDVWWSDVPTPIGVFGGHSNFGTDGRFWDFRSAGRGKIDFESIVRVLNQIGYAGPLSVEWEDSLMNREFGATEACAFVRKLDFPGSDVAFDAAFAD